MKNSLKINSLSFCDFPVEKPLEAYHENTDRFVDYFRRHIGVKAIYGMGGINDPGISDLDLILVLKENGTLTGADYQFLDSLDGYLFAHRPFVIPENLFPHLPYLFFASNLTLLWGSKYDLPAPGSDLEKQRLDWILCSEAAVGRLFDLVYQTTFGRHISLRGMLLKLNSIKHNIRLFACLDQGFDEERFERYGFEITKLRSNWFTLDQDKALKKTIALLGDGIELLLQLIDLLAGHYPKLFANPLISNCHPQTYYFILPNSLQIARFEKALKASVRILPNPLFFLRMLGGANEKRIVRHINDISTLILPHELICLFWPLLGGKSETSRILTKGLVIRNCGKPEVPPGDSDWELFRQRHRLLDQYTDFMQKNKISDMSVLVIGPWYLGGKARFHALKDWILRGIIKIRWCLKNSAENG